MDGVAVDEFLLRIETAESEAERARIREELDELVAGDESVACAFAMQLRLDRELRMLFENPALMERLRQPGLRGWFRRVRARFLPWSAG